MSIACSSRRIPSLISSLPSSSPFATLPSLSLLHFKSFHHSHSISLSNQRNHFSHQHSFSLPLKSTPLSHSLPLLLTRMSSSAASSSPSPSPTPSSTPTIMCLQLTVGSDKHSNISHVRELLSSLPSSSLPDILVLPEMWNCPYSNDSFGPYSENIPNDSELPAPLSSSSSSSSPSLRDKYSSSPSLLLLSDLSSQYQITVVGGSIPEKELQSDGSTKLYNTCCVFNPQGELISKHRKLHLFDINIPGKQVFRESDTLTRGTHLTTFHTKFGQFGLAICYDIRFPEIFHLYRQKGCVGVIIPGAFNTTTGPLHWELLGRARAVDYQMFIVLCSPARNPSSTYQAWGHSTIIDPWGKIIKTTEEKEEIISAQMELEVAKTFRNQIPTFTQRREDLYAVNNNDRDKDKEKEKREEGKEKETKG